MGSLDEALAAFREGRIVLVFDRDDREGETDMLVSSLHVTPAHVRTMRRDAGGLICTALGHEECKAIGIPFMTDVLSEASQRFPVLPSLSPHDIPYDERSSFSITVNHRRTFTGITDDDRALTIKELAALVVDRRFAEFGSLFRSPGHVPLLRGADGLLDVRRGHTEITLAMADMAGLPQVTTICEMMADTGKALPPSEAQGYAEKHRLPFISCDEIMDAWREERP